MSKEHYKGVGASYRNLGTSALVYVVFIIY
jgi:hypothetical protein